MTTASVDKMRETLHVATEDMRWRILGKLAERPMTLTDLRKALDTSPQHVLFHIRKLVEAKLVRAKQGTSRFAAKPVTEYSLIAQSYTIDLSKSAQIVPIESR
jgi:predicted ArsR family transcriptional regulator